MKNIVKKYKINATSEEVYKALTNSFTIELWTGYTAKMEPVPGSEFEMWEGDISGLNLEFIENSKIVQEWYFGEQKENSIVILNLSSKGNKTIIELTHTNIPDEVYEDIKKGWDEDYMGSLINFFK